MGTLTSLDYSDLLRFLAYNRHQVVLNKTQVNKLLFMCYGVYLSKTSSTLFTERPKAWPYGPVFPTVYKRFHQRLMPIIFSEEKKKEFYANDTALGICIKIVDKYCYVSAYELSVWSHQQGSPWYKTVYSDDKPIVWNKEISDGLIKDYFKDFI